jgi:hypothetical protein
MNTITAHRDIIGDIGRKIAGGQLIPFLGPQVLSLSPQPCPVPMGARDLSHWLTSRVAVPGRIRNNLWHSAQYIETFRHRVTLDKLMQEAFKPIPGPSALHAWLAARPAIPLIVDTWYDGTLARALCSRDDWGLIQGTSKARRTGDAPWYRAYAPDGAELPVDVASAKTTILYKPHGAAQPAGDVLASDADYVEVLTDIDLGLPIPQTVKDRRKDRGFVFLGCRFYDQILRIFARSIIKHSNGPRFALVPVEDLTRNELKFMEVENITPIDMDLAEATPLFAGATH